MRKLSSGSLETKLTRFLFTYRLTPHATTSQSPSEILLKRCPRSRLDVLFPNLESYVEQHQQAQKKNHDQHSKCRTFTIGDLVLIKDFCPEVASRRDY